MYYLFRIVGVAFFFTVGYYIAEVLWDLVGKAPSL